MPGIFFTQAWMLAGLAALSIPVVIHLLLRRKKKRVRFSTIQFFMQQDEQSSQRRKLRNWLLLSLRLLICTLLVLAFARPYLQNGGAADATRRKRQVLVVLDRSLSMRANASDGPKWGRARDAARQILAGLQPSDTAALIGCAGRAEVLSEWAPAARVSRVLDELQPSLGAASLGEGLQQAAKLLAMSDPAAAKTIYVISDLQRSACNNLAASPLPRETELKLIKVGDLMTPNLAVTDLQLQPRENVKPYAIVSSFSDEDSPDLKLEFSLDGQLVSAHALTLSAGASTNVELSLPILKPGWHEARVQLRGQDALALDNDRFQALFQPEPAHAWIVETRPSQRSFEEESFFVSTALDPTRGSTNQASSRFAFEKMSADELASKLSGHQGHAPCDLVIVPALKQVPGALANALTSYLEAGGGLVMFVGEGLSANRYNAEFRAFLPGELGAQRSSADWDSAWRIGEYSTNVTLFAAFQTPGSGDLNLARFTKRCALTPADSDIVVARFDDQTPFISVREVGRGRVVLVNTSMDTSWNDWPKHKTFVPWVHGTAEYLAERAARTPVPTALNLVGGIDTDIELGKSAAKGVFKVRQAGGKDLTWVADDQGQVRDVTFAAPGVYSLCDPAGTELRRVAVNVPVQESDLASLAASDFQQQIARVPEGQKTTLAAGLFGGSGNQRELWRVLLLVVLVLLLGEVLVANRTLV